MIEMPRELEMDICERTAQCFHFRHLNHWTEDTDEIWKNRGDHNDEEKELKIDDESIQTDCDAVHSMSYLLEDSATTVGRCIAHETRSTERSCSWSSTSWSSVHAQENDRTRNWVTNSSFGDGLWHDSCFRTRSVSQDDPYAADLFGTALDRSADKFVKLWQEMKWNGDLLRVEPVWVSFSLLKIAGSSRCRFLRSRQWRMLGTVCWDKLICTLIGVRLCGAWRHRTPWMAASKCLINQLHEDNVKKVSKFWEFGSHMMVISQKRVLDGRWQRHENSSLCIGALTVQVRMLAKNDKCSQSQCGKCGISHMIR